MGTTGTVPSQRTLTHHNSRARKCKMYSREYDIRETVFSDQTGRFPT
jgi:hypothetical protein